MNSGYLQWRGGKNSCVKIQQCGKFTKQLAIHKLVWVCESGEIYKVTIFCLNSIEKCENIFEKDVDVQNFGWIKSGKNRDLLAFCLPYVLRMWVKWLEWFFRKSRKHHHKSE